MSWRESYCISCRTFPAVQRVSMRLFRESVTTVKSKIDCSLLGAVVTC
jgi:hypothetical protein